jgi:hypothetical protein
MAADGKAVAFVAVSDCELEHEASVIGAATWHATSGHGSPASVTHRPSRWQPAQLSDASYKQRGADDVPWHRAPLARRFRGEGPTGSHLCAADDGADAPGRWHCERRLEMVVRQRSHGVDQMTEGEVVAHMLGRRILAEDGGVIGLGPDGEEAFWTPPLPGAGRRLYHATAAGRPPWERRSRQHRSSQH